MPQYAICLALWEHDAFHELAHRVRHPTLRRADASDADTVRMWIKGLLADAIDELSHSPETASIHLRPCQVIAHVE